MESVEIASPPNTNHTNTPHKTKRTEFTMPQILTKRKSRRKQKPAWGGGSVSLEFEFGILPPPSPSGRYAVHGPTNSVERVQPHTQKSKLSGIFNLQAEATQPIGTAKLLRSAIFLSHFCTKIDTLTGSGMFEPGVAKEVRARARRA